MGIRHYPDKVRVYVDMDGVIADFECAARAHAMEPSHFKRVAGAFLDLDPIPKAAEAMFALDDTGYCLVFTLTETPRSNSTRYHRHPSTWAECHSELTLNRSP